MNVHLTIAAFELAGMSAAAGAPRAGESVGESGEITLLYDIGGGAGTDGGMNSFSGRGGKSAVLAFSKMSDSWSGLGKTAALQVTRLFWRLRRRVLRTT